MNTLRLSLFINICFCVWILNACKGPQNSLKDYLSPSAWNRHTYLFADAFLASLENIGIRKCLKSGSFPIR